MARRKKSRSARALRQAKLASRVKYMPENQALADLLRDEDVNYRVGVRQEKGIAAGVTEGLNRAVPLVAQNYGRALEASAGNVHYTQGKLAPLGASADDIKAAAAVEAAGAHRRISESGATTLKEYAGRLADTRAGEAFAIRNLGNVRLANRGKIQAKQGSLARQQGMFTQAQYETYLRDLEDQDLAQSKAKETARHNRAGEGIAQQNADTSRQRANKPPKGSKPKAESQASMTIKRDIGNTLGDYQSKHGTRSKKGNVWTYQAIHKDMIKHGVPRDVANAALDLAVFNYLSGTNIARLRRIGVKIPRAWLRPKGQRAGGRRP